MIWPSNLVTSTFLNTFHAEEEPQPGRWTRFRFFIVAFAAAFAYCFLPGTSGLCVASKVLMRGCRVLVHSAVIFLLDLLDQARYVSFASRSRSAHSHVQNRASRISCSG